MKFESDELSNRAVIEQVQNTTNNKIKAFTSIPLSKKLVAKIEELREAGHKVFGIDENGKQYQFQAKQQQPTQPRSNSMYYAVGTFGVGIAGLIAAYFYFPELFKNISLPNFLKNIDFSPLKKLVSRGN